MRELLILGRIGGTTLHLAETLRVALCGMQADDWLIVDGLSEFGVYCRDCLHRAAVGAARREVGA